MTLEQCCEAFQKLLNQDLTYDGSQVIFRFENHTEALHIIHKARLALSVMEGKCDAAV